MNPAVWSRCSSCPVSWHFRSARDSSFSSECPRASSPKSPRAPAPAPAHPRRSSATIPRICSLRIAAATPPTIVTSAVGFRVVLVGASAPKVSTAAPEHSARCRTGAPLARPAPRGHLTCPSRPWSSRGKDAAGRFTTKATIPSRTLQNSGFRRQSGPGARVGMHAFAEQANAG